MLRVVATRAGVDVHTLIPNLGGFWFDVVDGALRDRNRSTRCPRATNAPQSNSLGRMSRARDCSVTLARRVRDDDAATQYELGDRRDASARTRAVNADDSRRRHQGHEPRVREQQPIPLGTRATAQQHRRSRGPASPTNAKSVAVVVDDPDAVRETVRALDRDRPAARGRLGPASTAENVHELDNTGGSGWTAPCRRRLAAPLSVPCTRRDYVRRRGRLDLLAPSAPGRSRRRIAKGTWSGPISADRPQSATWGAGRWRTPA